MTEAKNVIMKQTIIHTALKRYENYKLTTAHRIKLSTERHHRQHTCLVLESFPA